jgi:acyl-CoA thioesterase
VADFVEDASVELGPDPDVPGRAVLSERWAVWGPNGGYLAAIALRAAIERSRLPRPAAFHCHYLAVGEFAPVEVHARALGGGKRAESVRVELVQQGRTLLAASVWMVDDGLRGYEHDFGRMPEVPRPGELESFHEFADDYDDWFPIWRSMEGKPCVRKDLEGPGEPVSRTWLRFTDTEIADRSADALRQLFWLDFPGWNAATAAHPWPTEYLAPNLDLMVQFHRFAPEADWMLADGNVLVAADGLIGCVSRIWGEDGRLLATGTSKHLCRPNPGYAEQVAQAKARGLLPDDA